MLAAKGDTASKVGAMQQAQQALSSRLTREIASARRDVQERLDASRFGVRKLLIANAISGVAIVLALVLGAWLMLRAIVRDLGAEPEYLRVMVSRIADGDLRPDSDPKSAHEDSVLGKLQSMSLNLCTIVNSIRIVSQDVSDASTQIAEGNDDLSQRTQRQAAALEQTSASMQQMRDPWKRMPTTPGARTSSPAVHAGRPNTAVR